MEQMFFRIVTTHEGHNFHAKRIEDNANMGLDCYEYHSGKKTPSDIVGTTFANKYLISEKFRTFLLENRISGWDTKDVLIFVDGRKIVGYHELLATSNAVKVVDDLSRKEVQQPKAPGGKERVRYVGIYIDMETWDGSDIFTIQGQAAVNITEKVYKLILASELEGIGFLKLSEIENFDLTLKKRREDK